jgi:hypothetical protein
LEEINGDLPEEDFWAGTISGLPGIRPFLDECKRDFRP